MSEQTESVPEAAATASRPQLSDPEWAVIGDHYLSYGLTHDQATAEARDLVTRKQHAVVVTNDTAERMITNSAGVAVPSMPDLKF